MVRLSRMAPSRGFEVLQQQHFPVSEHKKDEKSGAGLGLGRSGHGLGETYQRTPLLRSGPLGSTAEK